MERLPLVLHQADNPSSPHIIRIEHLEKMGTWVINIGTGLPNSTGISLTEEQARHLANYLYTH